MPNYQNKTKDELINELHKLQQEYDLLKASYERDIAECRQAEEALLNSENKFSKAFRASPDVLVISRLADGLIIETNDSWESLFGYSREEVIGRSSLEIGLFANQVDRQNVSAQLQEQSFVHDFEIEIKCKSGEMRQASLSVEQIEIDSQPYMLTIIRDITERKQTTEALRLEKENFRHSLDNSPLGVRIATIEGNTIYANKTLLNFYGYDSLEELQKTPLKKRYTSESYAEAQKRKHQRERGDLSVTDYEISIVRKNREIRNLQVFRKEVLWDGVRQFQVICNDITERKHAEEEIRKSKELLENLHKHLNEILENERALISREIHDQIGQSLTALKLDMNWMHKYINTNPEAVAKLEGMIELVSNTTKDIQRISSDLRPGILDDLGLASAIEWYSEEFEKRTGIRCSLSLDDSILSDPQKDLVFFRVFQEALTNVIRHAKASSVRIKLNKSKTGTVLTIQDNGTGIPLGKVESGKSLGLIGMRERVRQFEGKIDISSKKGEGTKLTIFIPSA